MIKITANQVSTSGTSNGQILTSNGTVAYWTTGGTGYTGSAGAGYAGSVGTGYAGSLGYVGSIGYTGSGSAGGGGFSNGQSISVANLAITGSLTAANSVGTSGQALVSTGTGVQWGALSPGYNYSSQFNGSSNYLTVPSSSALAFGTGNFTIECWIYLLAVPSTYPTIVVVNGSNPFYFNFRGNGTLGITNATTVFATSTALLANAWYHIAAVRNSGSTVIYINGVAGTAVSCTDNFTQGSLNIGYATSSSFYLNAYISNLRILNGTALYTSNFTPPTSPLSAISGTSLLTCNAITPTSDSSTNNHALTNTGPVTTTAVQSPFTSTTVSIPTASLTSVRQQFTGDGSTTVFNIAGGYTANAISVFVNGVLLRNGTEVTVTNGSTVVFAIAPLSGALIDVIGTVPTTYSSITPVGYSTSFSGSQYLSVPDNTAFDFGSGNFTVECWIYLNSAVVNAGIITKRSSGANYSPFQLSMGSGAILTMFVSTSGSSWAVNTGVTISIGTWYHVAIVRNGTAVTLYLNGLSVATGTASGALMTNSVGPAIGSDQNAAGGNMLNGYISNMRVVKGVAVYTAPFLPVGPLAAVQTVSSTAAAITGTQTSLLTCNGPTIIDGSTNSFTITNNGSAPVSTAIVPTFTNVTINNSSSGGLSLASVQTANVTATSGYIYPINTTSANVYVTLPASPSAGQQIAISDYAGTFATYNCIINPNGNKISGSTANVVLAASREGAAIVYVDSTQGWIGYGNFINNPIGPYTVTYLIVAGGGAGGSGAGGGGGAGGFLTGTNILTQGITYNITVGAGGSGATNGIIGASGSNSSLTGITAVIGGGGGGSYNTGNNNGASGGSGGGGVGDSQSGSGITTTGGSATSGQGFAGGSGKSSIGAGGGGGAGATGANVSTLSTAGGAGAASTITGSSVTYAGGGGGSAINSSSAGSGGAGGGGAGGATNTSGAAGTTNTGGGGGGGGAGGTGGGGNGGSGVVILSIPTANYTGTKTGSPSVSTSGTYTILTFTASGTYTA